MKLTDIKTFVVGNPPPGYGGRYFVFVKLTTDGNVSGVGEAYCAPFHPELVARMLVDVFGRYLAGEDPHHIERIWRRVYSAGYTQHADLTLMACCRRSRWPAGTSSARRPASPSTTCSAAACTSGCAPTPISTPARGTRPTSTRTRCSSAERAAEYLAQGFTALKFDPAGPYTAFDGRQLSLPQLELCERFMQLLRAAVGYRADLLFGTHGQMTAAGAIRLARRLEPYEPLWFEEPVPPDAPEEMARVARATRIPIAAGERLSTKYDFARVLRAQAAAILQMNLGRVGGILEAKKIAALAEVQHVQLAPHLYCGPVVGAANIQLATCSPNFLILEGIERWQGFHAEVLKKPIRWEAGYVIPPTEPGLGVELDEAVIAAHPYRGDALHLEMSGQPLA